MASTLVIQLARFGDLIQTGRLIHALLRDGETHLCLDTSLVPLAKKLYPACHLHPVHAHGHTPIHEVYTHNTACFTKLQTIPFSAVYTLNYAGMNSAISSLFPPEILHGYIMQARHHTKNPWLHMMFRWITKRRTAPLNLMDLWGLLAPHPLAPSDVHPKASPKGGGLGIVLAGRNARRSLSPETLALCITALFERMDAPRVTLFGTEREQAVANKLLRTLRPSVSKNVTNLAGKTSLDELIAHVASLDCLFTPDTGTMHLAAALGTPVEAYFLSSAWAYETGPYGIGHKIWQSVQECAPCNEFDACPNDLVCATNFTDRGFLNQLMGFDFGLLPPSLRLLTTDFDELGIILRDVMPLAQNTSLEDNSLNTTNEDAQRLHIRSLFASLAPKPIQLSSSPLSSLGSLSTQNLIHETDWILPSTRP